MLLLLPDRLLLIVLDRRFAIFLVTVPNLQSQILAAALIRFETARGELEIYHPNGQRFLNSIEMQQRAAQAEHLLQQESQCADRIAEYLRSLGVDPDNLP